MILGFSGIYFLSDDQYWITDNFICWYRITNTTENLGVKQVNDLKCFSGSLIGLSGKWYGTGGCWTI